MIEKAIEIADWEQAECYLNGEWTALVDAKVPVLDRGFIFGDGVYEVISVDTVAGIRAPFRVQCHSPAYSAASMRFASPTRFDSINGST